MLNEPFDPAKPAHRYHLHTELVCLFEKIGGWQQPDHPESEEHALKCKKMRDKLKNEILHDLRRICSWMGFRHDLILAKYEEVDAIFMGNGEHSLNSLYRLHHDLEQIMNIMADYSKNPPELTQELATKIIHACGYKVKIDPPWR